ncbi:restriction endonuclease subunit S [Streptomyces sp. NPDC002076]
MLLNSTGTGTIGRSCIFNDDRDYMVDGHVTVLRADRSKVDPRWIDAVLRSRWGQQHLESHCFTGSTNQVELSRSDLLETCVPIPDLDEQRRIADIFDTLGRQLSQEIEELNKLALLRDALAEDSIASAIESSDGYSRLGELAQIASGVTLGSEPTGGSSVELPYLRVANVQDGYFDTGEMKLVRILRSQVERYALRAGDLLLTEGGDWDKLGRGAVWDGHLHPCLYQNHLFRVRCDPRRLLPEYLALYTSSVQGKAYFARIAKQTSNLATINSTELKAMRVPVPPLDLQRKIVDSIQTCTESIERSKESLAKIQSLKQGLAENLLTGRVRVA